METILKAMMNEELDSFRISNYTKEGFLVLTFTKICHKVLISSKMVIHMKYLNDENEEKTQRTIQNILNKLKEL